MTLATLITVLLFGVVEDTNNPATFKIQQQQTLLMFVVNLDPSLKFCNLQ